jgi:hypothetical protein
MEHFEWCPDGYRDGGLNGQKIAIVGYSHHDSEGKDYEYFTLDTIEEVLNGRSYAFFTQIMLYFGYQSPQPFWNNVLFFNFLPTIVGTDDERYNYGTQEQLDTGKRRVLRIIEVHRPDKMLVFSKKAWKNFPLSFEEENNIRVEPPHYWHSYQVTGGKRTLAAGLRHPQYANRAEMTRMVDEYMKYKT